MWWGGVPCKAISQKVSGGRDCYDHYKPKHPKFGFVGFVGFRLQLDFAAGVQGLSENPLSQGP